jgi:hypothetical protein
VDNRAAARSNYGDVRFREIVARYGLDFVVVPERVASARGFQGLSGRVLRSGSNRYVLYGLNSC